MLSTRAAGVALPRTRSRLNGCACRCGTKRTRFTSSAVATSRPTPPYNSNCVSSREPENLRPSSRPSSRRLKHASGRRNCLLTWTRKLSRWTLRAQRSKRTRKRAAFALRSSPIARWCEKLPASTCSTTIASCSGSRRRWRNLTVPSVALSSSTISDFYTGV